MRALSLLLSSAAIAAAMAVPAFADEDGGDGRIKHVLLISVDGLHGVDVANCLAGVTPGHTCPNIERLTDRGLLYSNAQTTKPSDSFPGIIAQVSGGTPKSTGVYYDDSYDRMLFAPPATLATPVACAVGPGTATQYAENVEFDNSRIDGGVPASVTTNSGIAIDPAQLPGELVNGKCVPVWPHNFLRVNTLFQVLHNHDRRTAWSDKHAAYDILNGPNVVGGKLVLNQGPGHNIDDFFAPEVNSNLSADNVKLAHDEHLVSTAPDPSAASLALGGDFTGAVDGIEFYDGIKVHAVLNEIKGLDHTGTKHVGVPAIFGMNFQAVSVGQKLPVGGYLDSKGTPTANLQNAIDFVDRSIGQFLDALDAQGLSEKTLVIVSAKHGQSPIDPNRFSPILDKKVLTPALNHFNNDDAFHISDDATLEWLAAGKHGVVDGDIADLIAQQKAGTNLGLGEFLSGEGLKLKFADPLKDSRVPDFIITPNVGTVYLNKPTKIAEHGGFNEDDVHVALIVSHPDIEARTIETGVQTTQIAPTILRALGFDPNELEAVRMENTQVLPGLHFER